MSVETINFNPNLEKNEQDIRFENFMEIVDKLLSSNSYKKTPNLGVPSSYILNITATLSGEIFAISLINDWSSESAELRIAPAEENLSNDEYTSYMLKKGDIYKKQPFDDDKTVRVSTEELIRLRSCLEDAKFSRYRVIVIDNAFMSQDKS